MEIIICDHSQQVIDTWVETFILDGFINHEKLNETYQVKFICGKVEDIIGANEPFDAVVSAANSFLFMDGGSDQGYMDYYQKYGINIQGLAQDTVKFFNIQTALGRYCLPIGSCMLVSPNNNDIPVMISAPTMHLPEDVSETKNATYAMYSVLRYLYWYNKHNIGEPINRILVPSLCTGYGKMSPATAALQTFNALILTLKPKFKKKSRGEHFYPIGYIRDIEPAQPDNYENQRELPAT
jgi:O-acetyl-ADP-ribose deacetylase (regulator of RNase III)